MRWPGLVRVFLDANVLFTAAHNPNGKAAFLISLGSSGLLQLATSAYAQEESKRNLERKYPDRIDAFGLPPVWWTGRQEKRHDHQTVD
jgi:hypothetical protein